MILFTFYQRIFFKLNVKLCQIFFIFLSLKVNVTYLQAINTACNLSGELNNEI